eukprot:Tbor_TRINITY_DN5195_c0_g1::TRINITY_DN5195_c0_g1_i1::g.25794::m.25794/K00384/trxB, TRR; thioredoxin reductase (NADPH)
MSSSSQIPQSQSLAPPGSSLGGVDPDTKHHHDDTPTEESFDFDLFVIGGGSGGIACAKAAAKYVSEKKIALCDFVLPSSQGATWGLGGTCVNVGCVPKKLMHQAAIIGESIHHCASAFGWGDAKEPEYDENFNVKHGKVPPIGQEGWSRLVENIQNHIAGLNFGYCSELMVNGVEYINGYARFTGPHTVECTLGVDESSQKQTFTARRFLLATGCRPCMLNDVPGAVEHCITSDDLFSLKRNPGKTLFIGAGYIALECAGFINGFGNEAKVMMRSIPLRGFDRQMSQLVVDSMKKRGVEFIEKSIPKSVEKLSDGSLKVKYETTIINEETQKTETTLGEEVFDTVCVAVGRQPNFSRMNLSAAGDIALCEKDFNKIIVDQHDRTSVPHIYAIGDTVAGCPELMPVAVRMGRLLANRLFNGSSDTINYENIPTTVFSPLEYACVGLSEEAAIDKYVIVEVYHTNFTPLEWTVPMLGSNECYMKVIVNPLDKEKVLGFHVLAPNAGEIVQGVALAMQTRSGLHKGDLDSCVGIHPTVAEEMTSLTVSKSSGVDPNKKGC